MNSGFPSQSSFCLYNFKGKSKPGWVGCSFKVFQLIALTGWFRLDSFFILFSRVVLPWMFCYCFYSTFSLNGIVGHLLGFAVSSCLLKMKVTHITFADLKICWLAPICGRCVLLPFLQCLEQTVFYYALGNLGPSLDAVY